MDHKKAAELLGKVERPPAYVVLWHDGERPHFHFGGDTVLAIGMARYAGKALENYAAERMPLVQVNAIMPDVVPGGNA